MGECGEEAWLWGRVARGRSVVLLDDGAALKTLLELLRGRWVLVCP